MLCVLLNLQMSNYGRDVHTQRQVIDYDRQFQEDLERAQALSLESLALEKFKLQKEQLEYDSNLRGAYTQQQQLVQDNSPCSSSGTEADGALQYADRCGKNLIFFFNLTKILCLVFIDKRSIFVKKHSI